MIDTIKIFSMIDRSIYDKICSNSIVKTAYHSATGEIYYKIVNDSLEGSFSSNLSVRVGEGIKYKFIDKYYIEIEGSYHKLLRGYNSHNGFYNISLVCKNLIDLVNISYGIKLPHLKHWFLQRCDVAICYNLDSNINVRDYINNLSLCNFPRRNIKYYQDETIYMSGTTTTLKIYNKLIEFKKHDIKKFMGTGFDINNYLNEIQGFIRFECEIKKKKLKDIYNKNYIRVISINYNDLKEIWRSDFMKFLKMFDTNLKQVRDKKEVEKRLYTLYGKKRANLLYNFYISLVCDGVREVKMRTTKSTYYRNIKDLKEANIDFSQKYQVVDTNLVYFNPFEYAEVS